MALYVITETPSLVRDVASCHRRRSRATFNSRIRETYMKQFLVIAVLVVASGLTLAQVRSKKDGGKQSNREIERLLLKLEDEWAQVDVTNDRSVFQRIIAPDFVETSRSGKFHGSRQEWLADWEYEGVKSAKGIDMKVHIYADNMAVVTGIDRTVGIDKDAHEWVHEDRCTDTWVKRDGIWHCVAAHCNRTK